MKLSILIPSLPERAAKLASLLGLLRPQVEARPGEVELLALIDFRTMSLGEKRNRLMSIAAGEYIVNLDDDDSLVEGAIDEILSATADSAPDVVAYDQEVHLNGEPPFRVVTSIEHENEATKKIDGEWITIKRKPWHWCCWRASLARQGKFIGRVDEDWQWLQQVLPLVKVQRKLDRVLHVYRFNLAESLCQADPEPEPEKLYWIAVPKFERDEWGRRLAEMGIVFDPANADEADEGDISVTFRQCKIPASSFLRLNGTFGILVWGPEDKNEPAPA